MLDDTAGSSQGAGQVVTCLPSTPLLLLRPGRVGGWPQPPGRAQLQGQGAAAGQLGTAKLAARPDLVQSCYRLQ